MGGLAGLEHRAHPRPEPAPDRGDPAAAALRQDRRLPGGLSPRIGRRLRPGALDAHFLVIIAWTSLLVLRASIMLARVV